ncbi:MAG: glycoside hydrolase family 2 protein, partial [Pseudolysinimonas sp.]
NDPDHGSMHEWEMWNRHDYEDYRDVIPRFVGEFGWQGPPTWSTMSESISDDPLTPESPGMITHQKALEGNDKLTDGLTPHIPFQDATEDWHWAMSLNQAVAVRTNIEHLRSHSPRCAGSVVWQLNDCWPVTSWAAVDGYGRAKPVFYAIRHAYSDRLVTIQPRDGSLVAAVVNDDAVPWAGELILQRFDFDGKILAESASAIAMGPRETLEVAIPRDVADAGRASRELLVATLGDARGAWYFAQYRDSELSEKPIEASAEPIEGGYAVTVTARALARDVTLLVDKVSPSAVVDDMLVTLLPGESVVFRISTTDDLNAADLLSARVLRTANQLLFTRRPTK